MTEAAAAPSTAKASTSGPSPIATKDRPWRSIPNEDLRIGTHPRLFNKDRTRYGGTTVIPKHILEIEDDDKRIACIDEFEEEMAKKPLTDEEKRQDAEWSELIFGPDPLEPLDDDIADAVIAWSEGRGKFPAVPGQEAMWQ